MSRTSLTIALLTALGHAGGAARAQIEFDFGFLAGASLSTISGDTGLIFAGPEFDDFDNLTGDLDGAKLGMTMGVFMAANIDRDVSVRIEALYNELGGKGSYAGSTFIDGLGDTDLSGNVSMKTAYLEFPALVLFPLPVLPPQQWRGMLGMAICFAATSELRVDSAINGYAYSDPLSYDDRVQDVTYHGIVGLEYTAYVKETPFLLGLRYEIGLRRFDTGIGGDPDQEYMHRSFVATLGIPF
ncbi:outer membrane beta-barrel protein [bacterium]|nr:outer membrane beta-barrel protein [bacterium]